jgi:ubiquinone/menaquinone biosynthesis C-methylase UbiE
VTSPSASLITRIKKASVPTRPSLRANGHPATRRDDTCQRTSRKETTGTVTTCRSIRPEQALERERRHFDRLAAHVEPASTPPRPPDEWEQPLLSRIGDIAGRTVLELGCGAGDLSLALLERGAHLTALDLSPGMVNLARKRAALYRPGAHAEFIVAPVEHTNLPGRSFDLVVGKWILHHLDVEKAGLELRRLLRDDGRGIFAETSALNPLLLWARRRLVGRRKVARYGTDDEHPLGQAEFQLLRRHFSVVEVDAPVFWLVQMVDRHLLQRRFQWVSRFCRRIDNGLVRVLPWLRRYSYWIVVEVRP